MSESVVIIPCHGIQLETHRGLQYSLLPSCPLSTKRRFIPLTSVRDIVINEGLRRWDVRYYLCVIRDAGPEVSLEVVFEVGLRWGYVERYNVLKSSEPLTPLPNP
jgi:phosphatidylinositol N-acetylglucosaminyltransferase subunit H